MFPTTLGHGSGQFRISQANEKDHHAAESKADHGSQHAASLDPVTGGYDPAPADHSSKCYDQNIPGTEYFIKF